MVFPQAEGYFTNIGDFYGRGRLKEFIHVTFRDGKWQGVKIVGDSNVPRGKVTFQTLGAPDDIKDPTPAEVQVRCDTSNEDGFSWEEASVRFDTTSNKWIVTHDGDTCSFLRVHEFEALDAAENPDRE